jgi:hypothetical protein
VGREIGSGVADAFAEQDRLRGAEPGWRAERIAAGAVRGLDVGLREGRFEQSLANTVKEGVNAALEAIRLDLGPEGDGPLSASLRASGRRFVRDVTFAAVTPLALCAVAVALGAASALLLQAWRRDK